MSEYASCGNCLHVYEEHRGHQCLPTLPGGSPCHCTAFVTREHVTAEDLRRQAADLIWRAKLIERFGPLSGSRPEVSVRARRT